jgi:hypothetical protein
MFGKKGKKIFFGSKERIEILFVTKNKSWDGTFKLNFPSKCILKLKKKPLSVVTLVHRCTRVENPGEGVPDVFCQNP